MIEHLVNEIERCLKNDLQIAALTMALTLPDTCGKVYHPQASVSNRYTSWYDDHVLAPKSELTGDTSKRFLVSGNVVYKLRCAMLHESNPTVVGTEENITHFSLIWRPASSCSRKWCPTATSDLYRYRIALSRHLRSSPVVLP